MQNGKAYLKIPTELDVMERDLFGPFLEDLVDECSRLNYRFMSINPPCIRETWEGAVYEMRLRYTGDERASFLAG